MIEDDRSTHRTQTHAICIRNVRRYNAGQSGGYASCWGGGGGNCKAVVANTHDSGTQPELYRVPVV